MQFRAVVAPALLACVALTQIALSHGSSLSPWLGGGFGMFATIESRSERRFVVYGESPGLRIELGIPEHLESFAQRVRAWPREDRLRALAEAIFEFESENAPLDALRLQLWRTRYDEGTLRPRARITQELRVSASE